MLCFKYLTEKKERDSPLRSTCLWNWSQPPHLCWSLWAVYREHQTKYWTAQRLRLSTHTFVYALSAMRPSLFITPLFTRIWATEKMIKMTSHLNSSISLWLAFLWDLSLFCYFIRHVVLLTSPNQRLICAAASPEHNLYKTETVYILPCLTFPP